MAPPRRRWRRWSGRGRRRSRCSDTSRSPRSSRPPSCCSSWAQLEVPSSSPGSSNSPCHHRFCRSTTCHVPDSWHVAYIHHLLAPWWQAHPVRSCRGPRSTKPLHTILDPCPGSAPPGSSRCCAHYPRPRSMRRSWPGTPRRPWRSVGRWCCPPSRRNPRKGTWRTRSYSQYWCGAQWLLLGPILSGPRFWKPSGPRAQLQWESVEFLRTAA
mmetsp:Transcript_44981/g.71503  ORF Transcript_44981/g.71503 Transcript_44981/m.71503 type:complete len:212 (-) Transcript_44981:4-639(-)